MSKPLYKATIVIWSEFDPSKLELDQLGRESIDGEAYCSKASFELVTEPTSDEDWDGTEFFNVDDDE